MGSGVCPGAPGLSEGRSDYTRPLGCGVAEFPRVLEDIGIDRSASSHVWLACGRVNPVRAFFTSARGHSLVVARRRLGDLLAQILSVGRSFRLARRRLGPYLRGTRVVAVGFGGHRLCGRVPSLRKGACAARGQVAPTDAALPTGPHVGWLGVTLYRYTRFHVHARQPNAPDGFPVVGLIANPSLVARGRGPLYRGPAPPTRCAAGRGW